MTKIYAELDRMSKTSLNLSNEQEKFSSIRNKMKNIVDTLGTVWQGTDAETFYGHANNYLDSLTHAENVMIYFSNKMNRKTKKYSSAYDQYKERIKNYESTVGNNTGNVPVTYNSLDIGVKDE